MDRAETPPVPDEFTCEYFDSFRDLKDVPAAYKKDPQERIFVTRDLNMHSIKYVGFDMDYTLAVYNSPLFESITYDLALKHLISMGYPEEIGTLKYDASFPIRGLFVDTLLGNFLKVDAFRYIYQAVHGRTKLTASQRREIYPSTQVPPEEIGSRYFMMNTLFNLVDACLFSDLVVFYEKKAEKEAGSSKQDVHDTEVDAISFTNMFNDIRKAVDTVHGNGELKDKTIDMVEQLVDRSASLSLLLDRLEKAGKKTFLLTNSGYSYTERLMSYMLNGFNEEKPNWKDYFDYIIVGAKKPSFFSDGNTLREVNLETGQLKVKRISKFEKGHVYNGGSMTVFSQLSGSKGQDVLYVGDHIFSDVIVSKKQHRWRNLLVIRELANELEIQESQEASELLKHLENLNFVFREIYRGTDSSSTEVTDISLLRKHIKKTVATLSNKYNCRFGSLFRSGSKNSFFAMQVLRYADMYTADFTNLLNYPFFYYFSAPSNPIPHERTHEVPMIP